MMLIDLVDSTGGFQQPEEIGDAVAHDEGVVWHNRVSTVLERERDDHDPLYDDDTPALSSYARCADGNGTLTPLFFSDDQVDIARAKAICAKCGLAPNCLADALARVEPYGVWGGQLVVDGVIVEVKRGRGRPPKTPRPPLVVDEVPIPPHLVA